MKTTIGSKIKRNRGLTKEQSEVYSRCSSVMKIKIREIM